MSRWWGIEWEYWVKRRRQWHPTPVLLPRKSHGQRSLVGCSPWGRYSRTWLSYFTFTFHFHALEKEMATHSSVLAWRIPGTGSLVGCRLWGRTESDTTEAMQQQQQHWVKTKDREFWLTEHLCPITLDSQISKLTGMEIYNFNISSYIGICLGRLLNTRKNTDMNKIWSW